jgi:hypothetical protein
MYGVDRSKAGKSIHLSEKQVSLLRLIFKSAMEATKKWGGKLHVAYLPSYENVQKKSYSKNQKVLAIMQELGIPVINVSEVFAKAEDPLLYFHFRLPSHYNAEGYGKIAERIDQYLVAMRNDQI